MNKASVCGEQEGAPGQTTPQVEDPGPTGWKYALVALQKWALPGAHWEDQGAALGWLLQDKRGGEWPGTSIKKKKKNTTFVRYCTWHLNSAYCILPWYHYHLQF